MSLESRFWAKVDKRGPDECWPWTGALTYGYGVIGKGGAGRGTLRTHRLSAQLAGMDIEGVLVLHSCDNRKCVNPAHLRPGTHRENTADMHERGRANPPRGEEHWSSKLTEEGVREIRRRYAEGESQRAIALNAGVSKVTIGKIVNREYWAHVA